MQLPCPEVCFFDCHQTLEPSQRILATQLWFWKKIFKSIFMWKEGGSERFSLKRILNVFHFKHVNHYVSWKHKNKYGSIWAQFKVYDCGPRLIMLHHWQPALSQQTSRGFWCLCPTLTVFKFNGIHNYTAHVVITWARNYLPYFLFFYYHWMDGECNILYTVPFNFMQNGQKVEMFNSCSTCLHTLP